MNTQQERNQQAEDNASDNHTDVTRSQNREAVVNAAAHPARDFDPEGSGAGEQDRQRQPGSEGSHREGEYDKNDFNKAE